MEVDERLFYLSQYTMGKPQEIDKACLHMTNVGDNEARSLLDKRYDNQEKIVAAYIDNVIN